MLESLIDRKFILYFAEKILLPLLLRQTGQLYFTKGLKYDIKGVSSGKTKNIYVFGLPEGNLPKDKSSNVFISMLYQTMNLEAESRGRGESIGTLYITEDNCSGQNKNRFML